MLNRSYVILEKLVNEKVITIKQLSLLCNVPYSTIQTDIVVLNRILRQNGYTSRIQRRTGIGVNLENLDDEDLSSLLLKLKNENYKFVERDKSAYMIWLSLMILDHEYTKIDDLCDMFSVSRSSLNRMLKEARETLSRYNIRINSKSHYGLYYEGTESDVRQFIFEQLVYLREEDVVIFLGFDESVKFVLKERIVALIQVFDANMNDSTLEQFLLYLAIASRRIKKNHLCNELLSVNLSSFEYLFSEKIARIMEELFHVDRCEEEVFWIYRFVVGKCYKKNDLDYGFTDSSLLDETINSIFSIIKEKYGYNFTKDLELYAMLSVHLKALFKRIQLKNYSINPMINEIKKYSLLGYDMAVDACLYISNKMGVDLPDDEISYFAIYLHLAIERAQQKIVPKRILVVCPSGKGMSQLATHYLRKQFKDYISYLDACGVYELNRIDFRKYDCIFTMTPLHERLPLPLIEFSLNDKVDKINEIKRTLEGEVNINYGLLTFTLPGLFINDIEGTSKNDVLFKIIERIKKYIPLKDDFLDSVIHRENIISTELDYGYAIPHPLENGLADRSFFSVTVLNKPVRWGSREVWIILLSYIQGDDVNLPRFYDSFAQLISNREYALSLIENPSYENLLLIAKKIDQSISM